MASILLCIELVVNRVQDFIYFQRSAGGSLHFRKLKNNYDFDLEAEDELAALAAAAVSALPFFAALLLVPLFPVFDLTFPAAIFHLKTPVTF